MDRRERLLGGVDLAHSTGLEIGALHAPIVRRDEGRILYVDYAATEVVRANRNDPNIDPETIVEVDIVWGERRLAEAAGERVDYVVASHVIEHVPDLIGWLDELAEVLKPGGVLGLAIPDRRFTFDRLRNETTVADVFEAWLDQRRLPRPRQILDVAHLGVEAEASRLWAGDEMRPDEAVLDARLAGAVKLATQVHAAPRYVDIHCWVFTPTSFLSLARSLATLGRFPFRVEAFFPTEPGGWEFHARLVSCVDPRDPAILSSIAVAQASAIGAAVPGPEAEVEAAPPPAVAAPVDDGELLRVRAEAQRLRDELEALRASTSWRATAPFRALVGWLRR